MKLINLTDKDKFKFKVIELLILYLIYFNSFTEV